MIAHIQTHANGEFYNVNAFVAAEGFHTLGWEVRKFVTHTQIQGTDPEEIVVGGIANVRGRLETLGKPHSGKEIDYPEELQSFLGRKVTETTLEALFRDESQWGVFAKPRVDTKKFAGKVFDKFADFIGLTDDLHPTRIWCSEKVHFQAEWRCFIRYGEILDVRRYKGRWDSCPDAKIVQSMITAYAQAPAAYALDVGLDQSGRTLLVEVNDGHSLGTYGLGAVAYARFLAARWAQMSGSKDYLR